MNDAADANAEFDALWEDVQKARLIIGNEEKGVEITFESDLSLTGVLKKIRELSRSGHAEGLIGDKDHEEMEKSASALEKVVSHAMPDSLLKKVNPFR